MAFTPHPNDDAAADAPLLLAVTSLTTDVGVNVGFVRTLAGVEVTLVTTALGEVDVAGVVKLTAVTALANVGAVVPGVKVKKSFAVGAVTSVTTPSEVPWPITTVCGGADVPLTTGTFNTWEVAPEVTKLIVLL
jgi:hypothetical protein